MRRYKRILRVPTPKEKPLAERVQSFYIKEVKDEVLRKFVAPKKGTVRDGKIDSGEIKGVEKVFLRAKVLSGDNIGYIDATVTEGVNSILSQAEMLEGDLLTVYFLYLDKSVSIKNVAISFVFAC